MLKFFSVLVCGWIPLLVFGNGLRIADASRAGVPALKNAALQMALADKTAVSIEKTTPQAALERLASGRADLIVLEHGNLPETHKGSCRIFAAEVFAVYLHASNPVGDFSRKAVKELLTDRRPGWGEYTPLRTTDIHRFALSPRAQGSGLGESLIGVDRFAGEVFFCNSTREILLLVSHNREAAGAGLLLPDLPADVKIAAINGVKPLPEHIASGKYLLCWRYYILAPEKLSSRAEKFLKSIKTPHFFQALADSGMIGL